MSSIEKLMDKVLSGASDNNIIFNDFRKFILYLGFKERIKGSHHIFTKEGIFEIINIQSRGNLAKAYQVKQVRDLIIKYKLNTNVNE